jgi:hypothetical protein
VSAAGGDFAVLPADQRGCGAAGYLAGQFGFVTLAELCVDGDAEAGG